MQPKRTFTIEEVIDKGIDFGQFYGSVNRKGISSVTQATEKFINNLTDDIVSEFEAGGILVDRESALQEVRSLEPLFTDLIEAWIGSAKREIKGSVLEKIFEEHRDRTISELGSYSKNKLLYTRPCELFYEGDKLTIEFND